jgi:oxygen-dependent protoporphyrinogen oxidase
MQATLPQFVEMERRYGSLVRGMAASNARGAENGVAPQLMSLRGGLQRIVDALLEQVGRFVRVSSDVQTISRESGVWHIRFADGAHAQADAVICALPAYAASRALRGVDPQLAELLERIRYNSIATVNVAYDATDVPVLPRTPGFVVPAIEGRRITAVTISTQKYPDRSPQDGVLLRAFIGGALQPQLVESSDEQLAQIAREEFADLLGIRAQPRFAVMRRWMRLLPEYGVGHLQLVASMEECVGALSGLALAGSAYRGVGIPDCVASGQAAAARVLSAWELSQSG